MDSIPVKLIRQGWEATTAAMTEWTKYLNYRTISLIIHIIKDKLRIIVNRLNSKAKELLAEKEAGFRISANIDRVGGPSSEIQYLASRAEINGNEVIMENPKTLMMSTNYTSADVTVNGDNLKRPIKFPLKYRLKKSLVVFILLHGCKT
ncbi:hypothetical protein DPMN_152469 [Dreissena polymorpha]|uniref:Uncharacterized protein n=1 Tax=Dreissena polymorpha TaxID=45954 RepID=A0A9D4FLB5_DREPO|nr:hypothetical protein DPMN_152469 [Dreissena polymorpha]